MIDMNATVEFHGATVRLEDEYHNARNMMTTQGTDLDKLHSTVAHLWMNIRDERWADTFLALMSEIESRSRMLLMLKLGLT